MARFKSPVIWSATFAAGVILGWGMSRPWNRAVAQTPAPAQTPARAANSPSKPSTDEGIERELAKNYELFRVVDRQFVLVAKAVSPAVVHILARKNGRREDGQPARFEESGSGVIVRAEGEKSLCVLTNHHVVEGAAAREISIVLRDGRVLTPEQVWSDSQSDVAVVKLGRADLPFAKLGDSDDAAVGTWVVALGSPFGLTHSVSHGIISARGRFEPELEEDGVEHQEFLQTDAAINPGNSGGPLVNMKGEVIGINTAIASNGGGSEGVGFSIPSNLARWAMVQLVASGKVSRGAMGVRLQEVDNQAALIVGLDRPRGARIQHVQENSPAAAAGLRPGDIILRFNGTEVVDFNHLINLVATTKIGQVANVELWRDRKEYASKVAIADRDAIIARPVAAAPNRPSNGAGPLRRPQRPETAASADLGVELAWVNDAASARRLGLDDTVRGVVVTKVKPDSPLAGQLKNLDVITTMGGRAVRSADDVLKALARRTGESPVELGTQRLTKGAYQPQTLRIP